MSQPGRIKALYSRLWSEKNKALVSLLWSEKRKALGAWVRANKGKTSFGSLSGLVIGGGGFYKWRQEQVSFDWVKSLAEAWM